MAYRKRQGSGVSPATRITQEIIARLEAGTKPWIKPWRGVPVSRPLRACGIPYRGMNVFWLWMVADMCGYASPFWMTYNQAKSLGAQVRKGEKSTIAIFYKSYPSPALAELVDPVALERRFGRAGSYDELHAQACQALAEQVGAGPLSRLEGISDRLLPIALDAQLGRDIVWTDVAAVEYDDHDEHEAMARAIEVLQDTREEHEHHGAACTGTVVEKLATFALGSPAVCALRALGRFCPQTDLVEPEMIGAAVAIALGFRSLYNQPETRALLGEQSPINYWQQINAHAAMNDLPAVLDEYFHLVTENERTDKLKVSERLQVIAEKVVEVVALRPAQIMLDHWSATQRQLRDETFEVRARFAMRFANKAEDEKGVRRAALVQAAFKSPFRPFVLASTSIGQEGLDFHSYCARIVHWNLPRNPVDIEQREGRVHRFKNHAVRRNVAGKFSSAALSEAGTQGPWCAMFDAASEDEVEHGRPGDIIPFWIYPGENKIERVVLIPPFSREKDRYKTLLNSLATYRLAFGQPRQEELIELFSDMDKDVVEQLAEVQLSLKPAS